MNSVPYPKQADHILFQELIKMIVMVMLWKPMVNLKLRHFHK